MLHLDQSRGWLLRHVTGVSRDTTASNLVQVTRCIRAADAASEGAGWMELSDGRFTVRAVFAKGTLLWLYAR